MIDKQYDALIIFARRPELGKVKTRLAATLGEAKALEIYIKLLTHTRAIAKDSDAHVFVFLTETSENTFWSSFDCELQQGITLGEKMHDAFKTIFAKGYKKSVIIGSDCPDLSTEIIRDAFQNLEKHDAVIGGANDGGYYLLGTKRLISALFKNKEWSTANVYKQTLRDFKNENLSYSTLPFLNDVDEEKDVPTSWI